MMTKSVVSVLNEIGKFIVTCDTNYDNIYKMVKRCQFETLNKVLSKY